MTTIKAKWESFEADVLPKGCSEIQRAEMRKAFYGGAFALLMINNEIADLATEAEGVALLEALHQEAKAFVKSLSSTERTH